MHNGFKIRSYMRDARVKGSDIADSLGVTRVSVSQVIHGIRKSQRIQEAISSALNRPVSELWPDTKTDQSKEAA